MKSHSSSQFSNHDQSGVALIISLVLLVIMTLLGTVAIRLITSEERMTANSYDRSLAFQSTEAALKTIELLVEAEKPTPTSGACSVIGSLQVCPPPAANSTPRWLDGATTWRASDSVGAGNLAVTPEYFVEYLGDVFPCRPGDAGDPVNCKRYRITARTGGGNGRANVTLQSVYATD
jgi:type IV pilus assembly protein PilX